MMDYKIIAGIFVAGALLWAISVISEIRSDIKRINISLNKIAKQAGVPDTITDELRSLISEGKIVEAVKKYRIAAGVGLKEAKEYVDSLRE